MSLKDLLQDGEICLGEFKGFNTETIKSASSDQDPIWFTYDFPSSQTGAEFTSLFIGLSRTDLNNEEVRYLNQIKENQKPFIFYLGEDKIVSDIYSFDFKRIIYSKK